VPPDRHRSVAKRSLEMDDSGGVALLVRAKTHVDWITRCASSNKTIRRD
jgi:hypothetical protein